MLRGIPGGVQKVARATDSACTLGTQGSTAQPLVGRSLQGHTCLLPLLRLSELQVLDLKARACPRLLGQSSLGTAET